MGACPACGSAPPVCGWAVAGGVQWPIAACSGRQAELLAGATGSAGTGSVQCPSAACSGRQVVLLGGATGAVRRAGAGSVQCPKAACSGEHVVLLDGATGAGRGAGAGNVQCPKAACSGKHVVLLAGAVAGDGGSLWASAGADTPVNSSARMIFMLRLHRAAARSRRASSPRACASAGGSETPSRRARPRSGRS